MVARARRWNRLARGAAFSTSCALAAASLLVRDARADTADDVVSLAPPPSSPSPPPVPVVAKPPDLTPYLGRRVASVETALADDLWKDVRLPDISELHEGDALSAPLARRALQEALASGAFADASLEVRDAPGGAVHVRIVLMPRKVVSEIRVDTHGVPLAVDEILREAELSAESDIAARDVPALTRRIDGLLQRRGYPAPRVTITTREADEPTRAVFVIDVVPGAPRRVERRVLYPVGGSSREADDAERTYAVTAGSRADEAQLVQADAALEARIRARGRHDATVSHDLVLHRGIVVLRVRIDYGPRIETRYEGNEHFDRSTLDGALDLVDDTDRSPTHLAQKLVDFYVRRGFLDATVRVERRERRDERESTFLVFHVEEGGRTRVVSRTYPCFRAEVLKGVPDAPRKASAIGDEVDSFLEEELPGNELFVAPSAEGLDEAITGHAPRGARPDPVELAPRSTFVPETYERALQHVQELYRAEGFLGAQVGPVQVLRATCDPRSPVGTCRPLPHPAQLPDACAYDASGLPLPVPPLDPASTCTADAGRGVTCAPEVALRIPVKLGPRTELYDLAFSGAQALSPTRLQAAAELKLGSWVSALRLEEARRRVADAYREEGYAFVDVKYAIEPSPDRTRARVRFTITESEKVTVRAITLRGLDHTRSSVVEKRIALKVGEPYRASLVRATEEQIATLGAFASVNVALDDPYVPQKNKTVIVTVVERALNYVDVGPGFSTGEGIRLTSEYGHRNLWGNAVQLTARLQLAFIPTPFIIDPTARQNYRDLNTFARLGSRATVSLVFPEIGLGPKIRAGIDGIVVHDLQRDFYLTKLAAIPSTTYRPAQGLQITLSQSAEFNNSRIFRSGDITEYLQSRAFQGFNVTDLVRQLLVPDGETFAFAQRAIFAWDRRDNAPNASRGTYVASAVEHVDGYPTPGNVLANGARPPESHFFKLTQTFAGYIPLPKGLRIASQTRIGGNVQLTDASSTYPDRLFFMGGVDTMRGWNLNSFIPQDDVDRIFADRDKPDFLGVDYGVKGRRGEAELRPRDEGDASLVRNPAKFTPATRPIRGGNLMVIERLELRIPIKGPFETVLFGDMGNLWIDPSYPFRRGRFPVRAAIGTGLRVQTPVGPLAVDYGINITREPYEDFGAINFAIGLF